MKKKELSEIRIERGYEIEDVAKRLGIGKLALREYETHPGIIPLSIAKQLLKLYRVNGEKINFV
ncbi:helix-turn-helix transcriptional regulator [Paenibacillus campi]|uniref:helix-turn-helix domain-containing protein n=1 Tax=Paenibacillus campi TaxID=3106031 RepID=UPI002AFEA0A1|nr:helix-turn-helix transcriptional regulator [Paenibacillus sp. SGZ-1014]